MPRPVDPDIDLHVPRQRAELRRAPWGTLGAIAAGGALGALARHGLTSVLPYAPGDFPWAIFWVNVAGCLLIGALMTFLAATPRAHRLVRPFLGVGVLGGFTTFSTYAVDVQRAVEEGAPQAGLAYLGLTPVAALAAVLAGARITRALLRGRLRRAGEDGG